MFCWHFKNNLPKMQRVLDPPCLKRLGFENRMKGLQFYFPILVIVLHIDGISVLRLFSLLHYNYVNICFCLNAALYSTN